MNAHLGGMGVSDSLGKCSPIYLVQEPKPGTNAQFVSLAMRHTAHSGALRALVNTIRYNSADFKRDHLKLMWVWQPSAPEQLAIVRYLEHEDRRIRKYIRAKQKLIALLNEQKQAVIQHAVTRGLDPSVELKPSGALWLGDVPEHWQVLRARYLFREVDCRSLTGAETHLSMSQRRGLVPSDSVEEQTLVSESYAGGKLCEVGDLVLNRLKAHLGVFALARQSGVISPDYTVLRGIRPAVMPYFEQVLRSQACRFELYVRAKGIVEGFWRLYTDDFYDIRLPVPPVPEQTAIVESFTSDTANFEHAIDRAERQIGLAKEYRTRLVADVVTGKLDVREAAANLPVEPEEAKEQESETEEAPDEAGEEALVGEDAEGRG
jgi:type I restriction enzyme, S subunit